jgi:hypothetical protein
MKSDTIWFFPVLLVLFLTFTLSKSGTSGESENSAPLQTNHMLGPSVIGSGAVIGSNGSHYEYATAGQSVTGDCQGANHLLLSGFWMMRRSMPVGIDNEPDKLIPVEFELQQNYPNPFNPATTIRYSLNQPCNVTLEIINLYGQRVRLLMNEQPHPAGLNAITWNGQDDQGTRVSSGTYFYRITAAATASPATLFRAVNSMVFIK